MSDDELASIETETLLLWGNNDPMFPLHNAERANRLIKHSRLQTIEQSSHLPYLDQPEKMVQATVEFLNND